MSNDAPQPLWREVVGDTEPWRKGRLFVVLFAVLNALIDLFMLGLLILGGYVSAFMVFAAMRLFFWLQYYLIWIGVHWVRWLQGGFSILSGIFFFVWSFEADSGPLMLWGLFSIGTGAYLGFAPSVYFFASRQKANRNWMEVVVVTLVFVLLLATFAAAILGISRYQMELQDEARHFADTAFDDVFSRHDTYFLLDYATARMMNQPNGRFRLTQFLQDATIRAGDVHEIKSATGDLVVRYQFPASLSGEGEMHAEGIGSRGRIVLHLRVVGERGDWKIDDIAWVFPDTIPRERPQ
jgi:hypothetical protein